MISALRGHQQHSASAHHWGEALQNDFRSQALQENLTTYLSWWSSGILYIYIHISIFRFCLCLHTGMYLYICVYMYYIMNVIKRVHIHYTWICPSKSSHPWNVILPAIPGSDTGEAAQWHWVGASQMWDRGSDAFLPKHELFGELAMSKGMMWLILDAKLCKWWLKWQDVGGHNHLQQLYFSEDYCSHSVD